MREGNKPLCSGVQVGHPSYSMKDVFPVGDRGNSFWLKIPPEYQTQNNEGQVFKRMKKKLLSNLKSRRNDL